jgi:hypothetical protein
MRLAASGAGNMTHDSAPAAVAGDYSRWVPLQHVQHQMYFCNIQMKHLQHEFETTETLATYI